ncbi:LytTr DNA-binding domain-containing protein [Isobaculum melis]|uniref:LytTr DNA-binding domain-containing protein n=1 Tax=Isobaculum melis TaxID=142588 RepID=A0A1H9UDF4_9LACT|nr:LytTr DNA-binding domain-containing protein [Isobaculum melis]
MGFVRVSKSLLLNINKVDKVAMDLNMRMLAYLKNGEIIQINRSYKKQFNQVLTAYTERKESQ